MSSFVSVLEGGGVQPQGGVAAGGLAEIDRGRTPGASVME